jgi:hypothetical protein
MTDSLINGERGVTIGRRLTWSLLVIGSSLVGSCVTDACGCVPAPAIATIYGRVTDAVGNPVPHPSVGAYSGLASNCHSSETSFDSSISAEDGRYRIDLLQSSAQDSVCVAFASVPAGSDVLAASDTVPVVLGFRFGLPRDTARIDFSLPSR